MAGLFTGHIFGGMSGGLGAGGTTPGLPAPDKAVTDSTAIAPVDPSSPAMDPNAYLAPAPTTTNTPLIVGGVVAAVALVGVMVMMSRPRRVTANRRGKHGRRRRARR